MFKNHNCLITVDLFKTKKHFLQNLSLLSENYEKDVCNI